ncbi:sulfatase-like hydrolase/transferase [Phytoactinopolyspora halotolerans]|uniref:Sulfatase-like hydrolase/transferase n=1 Tax=Phytoactinopolyspora halotolerans TaxID=1981512 RepID=A0A6L9S4Y2_9ACTN|nr:sulfatase-like hydrolase/transferase [Phytoactinopolyspora halotolerans]NED99557.1 sulfatase-like hydrolase/transferase [Phytoactinopolyspora halotolerans]
MPDDDRLNVLLVASDEQRWDTLGFAGNPAARTPHLDGLADEATVFDGAYTPFPLCCPSRASLWTGRMPRHHHVLGNWRAINPELREAGLGRAFREAGYHTIYNGKWHVPGTTPARMGFTDCSAIPAVLNGRDRGRYIEAYRRYAGEQGYELVAGHVENLTPADVGTLRTAPHRGTSQIALDDYLETWQTGELLRSLDGAPADKPWFAACSFNAPHFPMIVPAPYDQLIDRDLVSLPASFATGTGTKPKEVSESTFATKYADLDEPGWVDMIAHYLGMCALVDSQVGSIVEYLRTTGQLDRTIIVFTTDHGDMMGAHRLMEKGHLLHYEEALRVPLLVRHPDAVTSPARVENLVSMVDVAGSLCDLAGVPWNEADDGLSFADMVGSASPSPTRSHVTAETVLYNMDADANGEYVDPVEWDPGSDAINVSVRTGDVRYIYRSRDIDEFYDHTVDPGEQHNVAAEPSRRAERRRLRHLLAGEIADVFPHVSDTLKRSA